MMPGMVRALRIDGFSAPSQPVSAPGQPVSTPTTKFGGQPVGLATPQWPISAAWERTMRFVGQIGTYGHLPR
jgi:hypothetical protein